jgi:hypothetical protein
MQLERLAIGLAPGTPMEAIDLGIAVGREWWQPAIRVWLAVYLPLALMLGVVFADQLLIAAIALWWLKPLVDRYLLHVYSHAIFGDVPTVGATFAAWRRIVSPALLRQLTLHRLSLRRAFYAPVYQLEQQRGGAASQRMNVLGRRTGGTATLATLVFLHFETILFVSLALLVSMFTPENAHTGGSNWFGSRGEGESWSDIGWMDYGFYVIAVSIIEPFYVACGFALYLHRRTLLEGWDIELGLRRLQARLADRLKGTERASIPTLMSMLAPALLVAVIALGAVDPALANDTTPKQAIEQVLADPIFGEKKTDKVWQKKKPEEKAKDPTLPDFSAWAKFIEIIAQLLRGVVWVGLAIAVVAVLWWARRFIVPVQEGEPFSYRPPETLFGLQLRPDTLPADIPGAARAMIEAGRMRDGLSLLYRGALSALVHQHRVPLMQGDTEGDALRAARQVLNGTSADYFARLVGAWQSGAYGARWPTPESALALTADWATYQ